MTCMCRHRRSSTASPSRRSWRSRDSPAFTID
jgi:ribosomal protein L39E